MDLFLIGAGHVGLVTAVGMVGLGHRVVVSDIDVRRITSLQRGDAPLFEPGLTEAIRANQDRGALTFTRDDRPPNGISHSIVAVSTPADDAGRLSIANVEQVVMTLLRSVGPEHTIIIRSTLPLDGPDRLLATIGSGPERAALVYNPEFMREGSALADFDSPNRVIAAWFEPRDRDAAGSVAALYESLRAPSMVVDARSAVLIKLATNVFLATKVAYANELARICDAFGADVDLVTAGIGMDPRIGRAFLSAGPGFGGSCLPEQAVALARATADRSIPSPLIDAVSRSNDVHQQEIVHRLADLIAGGQPHAGAARSLDGRRIAVFGLAFKARTDDVRGSPGLALARYIRDAGGVVVGTDPLAHENAHASDLHLEISRAPIEAANGADAVVVATEWRDHAELDWQAIARVMRGDLVLDTRGIVERDGVVGAGLRQESLGRWPESVPYSKPKVNVAGGPKGAAPRR